MKVTKTYSIEDSLYRAFDALTLEKNVNKSSFIEDIIKKYLKDNNLELVDKLYVLKTDENSIVTVLTQDDTYYILNDGSKIQKSLFVHLFEEFNGVNPNEFFKQVEPIFEKIREDFEKIDTTEKINPNDFFNPTTSLENIANQIKDIDTNINDTSNEIISESKTEKNIKLNENIDKINKIKSIVDSNQYFSLSKLNIKKELSSINSLPALRVKSCC